MENNSLKRKAFSSFIWKFMERISAQLVSMVVSIVLARILLPEDYSVVSIVTIFFTFCNIFISGGMNTALIQKKDADLEDYSTIFFVNMFFSVILYIGMYFAAPFIANLYQKEILIPVIRVMGLTFFINSLKAVLSAYTSSSLQFKKFFFSTIIGTIVSAIVGIIMALYGFGAWALVAQQMINSLIGTIVLLFTTKFRLLFVFSMTKLKSLFGYGWKILVASFINVLYNEMNPLIVGLKYSSSDLSFYSKGKQFPGLLNSTLSNTLSSVLFPVMTKVQDDKKQVLNITRKYIKLSSYLIFPVMIGFFAVANNFVAVILTEKWLPAVAYIQIFCITDMFDMIQVGNLQAIKAIGRSDITLKLEIIKKSVYFLIIFVFLLFTDSPEMLAVSAIACVTFATIVNTYPNRNLIGYRYKYQLMDLLPNLMIAVMMGCAVMLMNGLNIAPSILLILQILVGGILYILLSIITKNENFKYMCNLIQQFLGGRKKNA